jgi:hypothetical protein
VRAALLVRRRREGVAGSGLLRGRAGEMGGESSMSTSASRAEGKETLAALPPLTIVAVLACRRRGHRIEPEGRGDVSSAPAVVSLDVGSGGTSCAREDLGLAARRASQLRTSCEHTHATYSSLRRLPIDAAERMVRNPPLMAPRRGGEAAAPGTAREPPLVSAVGTVLPLRGTCVLPLRMRASLRSASTPPPLRLAGLWLKRLGKC